ncbi:MAG: DUF3488 and transglutaminase-like domain-containing protein [Acidimicrobiales bacterium]
MSRLAATDEYADHGDRVDWGMELTLALVSAVAAVTLARAFRTWSPLGGLLLVVGAAHACGFVGRRLRLGAISATLASLLVGAVVIGALYYHHLGWSHLASPDTVTTALRDVRRAFGPFQKLVAPVDARRGFLVAFAIGLWLMATFADLAARRSDAPVQAVVAPVVLFVFSSVLLLGRFALLTSLLFVTSLALYRLAVRASALRATTLHAATRRGDGRVAARIRTGPLWAGGTVMVVVALLAGIVLAGMAPTPDDAVVDLRSIGRGPKSRVVESPLVSLDSLLGTQSDEVLFRVRSAQPHYWRLTALDDFDGRSWSASARYRDLDGGDRIDSAWDPLVKTTEETATFEVGDLVSDWLPTAFAPTAVDAPIDLRYDSISSSIFVADGESTERISYRVTSEVADLERLPLESATSPDDPDLAKDRALPASFSPDVYRTAIELTRDLAPFQKALALQDFFRSDRFRYDRNANFRDSVDPLAEFLRQGNGFCQQFATAFAAMARAAGLPARVAVGFTYGDPTTSTRNGSDGRDKGTTTWTIRGRYAHAWPEVYLHGIGWVPFEPTPGRGNPDATTYTDITPAQADAFGGSIGLGETTTTTTTTTTVPAGGAVPTTLPDQLPRNTTARTAATSEPSRTPLVVLAALVGLVLLVAGAVRLRVAWVRRRRLRRRDGRLDPPSRVEETWRATCRDLARVDVHAKGAETPLEFARRASRTVEVQHLTLLGRAESDRRFRRDPLDAAEAADAEAIADEVRTVVWSRLDRRQRLLAELDLGGD